MHWADTGVTQCVVIKKRFLTDEKIDYPIFWALNEAWNDVACYYFSE